MGFTPSPWLFQLCKRTVQWIVLVTQTFYSPNLPLFLWPICLEELFTLILYGCSLLKTCRRPHAFFYKMFLLYQSLVLCICRPFSCSCTPFEGKDCGLLGRENFPSSLLVSLASLTIKLTTDRFFKSYFYLFIWLYHFLVVSWGIFAAAFRI